MVVSAISVVTLLIREVIVHFDSTSHGYAIAREDRRKPIKGNFQSLSLSRLRKQTHTNTITIPVTSPTLKSLSTLLRRSDIVYSASNSHRKGLRKDGDLGHLCGHVSGWGSNRASL
jgi:hypothetical protein